MNGEGFRALEGVQIQFWLFNIVQNTALSKFEICISLYIGLNG